jgi:PLD-like domain
MQTQPSSPPDVIAGLIAGCPPAAVSAMATALRTARISLTSSSVGIDAVPSVSPETARRAASAFRSLQGLVDANAVATALDVGNELRRIERLDRPEIELVWTGPSAEGPIVRPTAEVVQEMIRNVRESGEVLLVGYSLTADDGSIMQEIIALLGAASKRRAAIVIILHRDNDELNRRHLMDAWDVFAKKPKVFTWDPPPHHPYTKLHAKALVVDRLDALVTSANLTFHGLESNLELGLRVRGPQAGWIAERFDHLIASEVLTEWKP